MRSFCELLLCVILTLWLPTPARGFSGGASRSACMDMKPGHIRAKPQDARRAFVTLYTDVRSYLPGDIVAVAVRSTRDFMGFLLQARTVAELRPAGSFVATPVGSRPLACVEEADTVTHADKLLKRNLSFVWRAPDRPVGDVRFLITVVQSYFVYWAGIESSVVSDDTGKSTEVAQAAEGVFSTPSPGSPGSMLPNREVLPGGGVPQGAITPLDRMFQAGTLQPSKLDLGHGATPARTGDPKPLALPLDSEQIGAESRATYNPHVTAMMTGVLRGYAPQGSYRASDIALGTTACVMTRKACALCHSFPGKLARPASPRCSTVRSVRVTQRYDEQRPVAVHTTGKPRFFLLPRANRITIVPFSYLLLCQQDPGESLLLPVSPEGGDVGLWQARQSLLVGPDLDTKATVAETEKATYARVAAWSRVTSAPQLSSPRTMTTVTHSQLQKPVPGLNVSQGGELGPPKEEAPERVPPLGRAQLGILLGVGAGLGMVLAAGLRYLHSQYCWKRSEVSFGESSRRGGVIHVQECGDLVQVRKIRQDSFVVLQAEYNVLTPPGN
ncbi:reelin domain-containing protein 1-like [Paramormyrops kingsleyae]|uniref:reelin domain-containing protein 1-like n=1 Tax=Paramormyrops kingsleyae TaxID=1676925 RepID=UPI003B96A8D7